MAGLELEHVRKVFSVQGGQAVEAVRDFTLRIAQGEMVALVGPSGCGKTTTLRLIAGLEQATGGTISIAGQVVNALAPKDRDVAMVFQHDALYPHMTARENITFGLKLRGHGAREIDRRIADVSEALWLTPLLHRFPETLSGGERRRVAIARAVARQPKVLLLDEPFSNLDAPMRAHLRLELKQLHRRLGATIVHVTHDQAEALALGDRVVVMYRGEIQQVAHPLTVYETPANLFVAGFIGSPRMNFARGVFEIGSGGGQFKIEAEGGRGSGACLALQIPSALVSHLSLHSGRTLVMGLRPEDIGPARDDGAEEAGVVFEGQVELVELAGPDVHLHLDVSGWHCIARWPREHPPSVGERVRVQAAMLRAHFFDADTGRTAVCHAHR